MGGTFHYANGAKYSGEWDKNTKDGRATVLSGDGICDTATFRADTPLGGRRKSLCLEPLMNNERVTPLNREAVSDYNSLLVGWSEVQKQRVPDFMLRRQEEIGCVYQWYCAQGAADENDACTLSLAQFQLMMRDCRVSCRQLPLRSTEKIFEESTGREEFSEPLLLLGHFRSALVRLAMWEECGVACMALPKDDSPEGRLDVLLDQFKMWSCKVKPGSFRELLCSTCIQEVFQENLQMLLMMHKLCAAATPEEAALKDIRYEVFKEYPRHLELQVNDVLELLQQAKLVAFDSQDDELLSLKNACILLTAPSIDYFDPTELPDFGKPRPPEPIKIKSRRPSMCTDLSKPRSRRSSVSRTPASAPAPAPAETRSPKGLSPVVSPVSRTDSAMSSIPPLPEPAAAENAEPTPPEKPEPVSVPAPVPLNSGIEAAVVNNTSMPAGGQYNRNTLFTTVEMFEGFARVAYVKASEGFILADADDDGVLSRDECENMMKGPKTDVSTNKLRLQLGKVLKNVKAAIQPKFDAYEAAVVSQRKLCIREKEELLEVCDDKNGKLFDKLDVDGDHHIDCEEFIKYINVMAMTRGQKAAKALIKHLLKCIDKRNARVAEAAAAAEETEALSRVPSTI